MSRYNLDEAPAVIFTTSGRKIGEFKTKKEAEQYVTDNNLEQVFREPELAELVVTGKKRRSLLEQGASNFKETFGINPKDAASFIPFVGDGIDVYEAGKSLKNGDILEGLGTLGSLFVPNIIEKPAKALGRTLKNVITEGIYYADDIIVHPKKTYKAIKDKRYIPFMSKTEQNKYKNEIINRTENEVKPFTKEIATNNVNKRNSLSTNIQEPTPETLEFFDSNLYPTIQLKKHIKFGRNLGNYNNNHNRIRLATRENTFGNHRFIPIDDILKTGAHEFGHFWSYKYPKVRELTKPVKKYFGPNKKHSNINIFSPIFKYKPGEWHSSPDEIIADVFSHKYSIKDPNIITVDSEHLFDVSDAIAKRWNLDERDAAQMVIDLGSKGYKNGGRISLKRL